MPFYFFKLKLKSFAILHFCLIINAANAQNIEEYAEKANQAYSKKEYAMAIELYSSIISKGYESDLLYYNLGNAYYRTNNIPEAILNYEKALKINPRFKDAAFNLNIANSKIIDKVESLPTMFFIRWWNNILNLFSLNTFAILSLVILFLSALFAIVYVKSNRLSISKLSFFSSLFFFIIFVLTISLAIQSYSHRKKDNSAIIFAPSINIKSSPDTGSKDIFVLHEGTKVQILDKIDTWYEIRVANGDKGWIPSENLKMI